MTTKLNCNGVGKIVSSPVIKEVSSTKICEFNVQFKRSHKNLYGKTITEYDVVTCTSWGSAADYIFNNCLVDMLLYVNGEWRQETWTSTTSKNIERNILKLNDFSIIRKDDEE